jgi:predicted phage tail protein
MAAMGCTSRGQAHRLGRWLLYSERLETDIVSFKTGLKSINLLPGKLINTLDQFRAGIRHAGRIIASTSTSITIDSSIVVHADESYSVTIELQDQSLITRTLSNVSGTTNVLTWVDPLINTLPLDDAIWMVTESTLYPETWRVLSIVEEGSATYTISALSHNTSKFDFIEHNLALVVHPSSIYTDVTIVSPIVNPVVSDSVYKLSNNTLATKISVSWDSVIGA